jgi:hypothetical protein
MSVLKIRGGTANHSSSSLCTRCRQAHIIKDRNSGQTRQLCQSHGEMIEVPWNVWECNQFDDKSQTPLWEMEKIAWRFCVDDRRKTAGFLRPAEYRERHGDDN